MPLKPPLALVAILALLAMHDLCVAEDAKQSLPQNAKQNSTQIMMEEVEGYTTPTLESEVDEPISEAELQRSKHHGSGKHHKKKCYFMGKPIPCPEKHEVHGKHGEKDDKYEKTHDDTYESKKKNKYEGKHGGKYHDDKHDYEDKPNDQYNDKHEYEDKPYYKPSYEDKKQHDYEPDYVDGGYEYYKTTDKYYKDGYEYKYDSTFGYHKSNEPYVDGSYEYRSNPYYPGRHHDPGLHYPKHHQGPGHHMPKGCRGNPTKPDNGAFSCGDTTRVGDVCYATCDNGYIGRPSATCRPDCSWGPVQGSCQPDNVTPANGPAPIIGRALPGLGPPSAIFPLPLQPTPMPGSTSSLRQTDAHALSQCVNDVPYTNATGTDYDEWSKTTCQFKYKSLQNKGGYSCTTWFISRDGNGYIMATAGHCVVNATQPGAYNVDPTFPDTQVCCQQEARTGRCTAGLFQVRAWATTQGFYRDGIDQTTVEAQDGAVLWVEQVSTNYVGVAEITPVIQEIVYNPPNSNLPATILFSDGYPGNASSVREGCDFATGFELWSVNTTQPISPDNGNTRQGRDATYVGFPSCPGHSGGRILNTNGMAIGIRSRSDRTCPTNGESSSIFTQIVNYPGPYGVNIVALQRGVRGSVQGLQWVTPSTGESCEVACSTYGILSGIGGWRPINGGSNDSQLCAGLINMPGSVGQQWLSGRTSPGQPVQCNITCATTPCFADIPAGGSYSDTYVRAPGPNTYTTASGLPQTYTPPVRCACTNCLGAACESQFWVPKDEAANCPMPKIDSISFYKPICRSNAPPSDYGWTGWVEGFSTSSTCEGYQFSNPNFSVWCPEGLLTCGGTTLEYENTASEDGAQWRQIISTGPVTKLELRWEMFRNPDRLQIFDHSTGSRGTQLLDTGYVGVPPAPCPLPDPINPAVFVLPQPSPAGVCASKDGCLGLVSKEDTPGPVAGCENLGPCVTSGFSVSQIEVVVTSACAGSEWRLQLNCA